MEYLAALSKWWRSDSINGPVIPSEAEELRFAGEREVLRFAQDDTIEL